ncbi:MAG: transcription antitermination factor NusB, partial [Phycisphaerae bacterium]
LAQAAWAGRERYDAMLAQVIRHWDPARVGIVERAVLRLTTHELANVPDVPAAVAVNEAIEIARAYGAKESAAFVNGVLDAVRSHLDSTAGDDDAGGVNDGTPTNRTDVDP